MAQRRMISKSISTSKKVNRASDKAALLYTWIIPHTDDFGHMDGGAEVVKAIVVPMRKKFTVTDVELLLIELESLDLITRYWSKKEQYLEITQFNDHQTFKGDRSRNESYPTPEESDKVDPTGNQKIPLSTEDKISEVKIREEKASLSFLEKIPPHDLRELSEKYKINPFGIQSKATDLKLYCESRGKKYKNYRAFLENALRKDQIKLRQDYPVPKQTFKPPEETLSEEDRRRNMDNIGRIRELVTKRSL